MTASPRAGVLRPDAPSSCCRIAAGSASVAVLRSSRIFARLVAALTVLFAGPAIAGPPCPAIAGGDAALERQDPEARLAFIRARLAHDAWRGTQWSLGFATSYGLITGASLVGAAFLRDRASVPDLYVGAGSGIVGLGLLAVSPLRVIDDHHALEAAIAAADPTADRCELLALAETMLIRDAKNEAFGRGWLIQSGNVLLGVGALLILGLGYQRWGSGVANGLGSIAVGELMILTQPHGLTRDLRNYRAGDLRPPQRRRKRVTWTLTPSLTARTYGIALQGNF